MKILCKTIIKTYRFKISALSALILQLLLLISGLSVRIGEPAGSDKAIHQKIFDFRQSEAKLR